MNSLTFLKFKMQTTHKNERLWSDTGFAFFTHSAILYDKSSFHILKVSGKSHILKIIVDMTSIFNYKSN